MPGWAGRQGTLLIAEVGGNHEGDVAYARELTKLACATGVDAVKHQVYSGDTLVNAVESPERRAHFARFELTRAAYLSLAQICRDHGVAFTASVWDDAAIEWLDPHIPYYKIGSGDLTAFPFLRRIARLGKPIILSTGLATLPDVERAVAYVQGVDPRYTRPENLALLQCTSMYPIPDAEAHLQVMNTYRDAFGLAVGYSDHTVGMDAAKIAIAMGADIVEFHFTDTRDGKTFRDHKVSFTPEEVEELVRWRDQTLVVMGTGPKAPTASERDAGHVESFRRGVYPARDLPAGTVLSEADLTVLRPARGIGADRFDEVVGRTLKVGVSRHQRLAWDMFAESAP